MSSKNAFELRAEMLQLAKDYMDQQLRINLEFADKLYKHTTNSEDIQKLYKVYTVEELIEKAKELYSFVSTKSY